MVIPADVRAALGLQPGEALHLRVEDERMVLERPWRAATQLRCLARTVTSRSFVDELLAEAAAL